ncbi:DUF1048 domain-containing protein [Streptomyces sp. UNOC14_S4]|uniref:DUF1048 domain-containing protein n=1 Tax=Streptomyces sp. UNOC14_S4 TaxID=2872340 RepID=UPI001E644249|nr:DUF1048 domain-containing protein [Streptomyces sp. UNOC14_S4]MCC3772458.1 DUF1048 domain-containing protein [Streptomyces sp. UNOC14_S4]
MTKDQVLDHCRTEWMFQDVPEPDLADMLAELRDHLEDAARAGKAPEAVVGEDVTAFATDWATARRAVADRGVLFRRLGEHAYAGAVALLAAGHLIGWTTRTPVVPASIVAVALFAVVMSSTPYWRAVLRWPLWQWMGLCFAFPVVLLLLFLVGGRPTLLQVPLWGTALFVLPGAVAAVRKNVRKKRKG